MIFEAVCDLVVNDLLIDGAYLVASLFTCFMSGRLTEVAFRPTLVNVMQD